MKYLIIFLLSGMIYGAVAKNFLQLFLDGLNPVACGICGVRYETKGNRKDYPCVRARSQNDPSAIYYVVFNFDGSVLAIIRDDGTGIEKMIYPEKEEL